MLKCSDCGRETSTLTRIDGDGYCDDCWIYCPVCGKKVPVEETVDLSDGDGDDEELVCWECL